MAVSCRKERALHILSKPPRANCQTLKMHMAPPEKYSGATGAGSDVQQAAASCSCPAPALQGAVKQGGSFQQPGILQLNAAALHMAVVLLQAEAGAQDRAVALHQHCREGNR